VIILTDPSGTRTPRTYATPRPELRLRHRYATLLTQQASLGFYATENRLQIVLRLACFAYALGATYDEIRAILRHETDAITLYLRGSRPVDGSLAIALWGIAGIIGQDDLLNSLATLDPNRLGSKVPLRYTRMLRALFITMQNLWVGHDRASETLMQYDRAGGRKRPSSGKLEMAIAWSLGLRTLLGTIAEGEQPFATSITARVDYLETTYTNERDNLDHEGLLDVHGLGILMIAYRYGRTTTCASTTLPSALLATTSLL
jgi:hypothetical protein